MRVKLAIASLEADYSEHLSNYISQYYSDILDVSVCLTSSSLSDTLAKHKFDVALLDKALISDTDLSTIALPLILVGETESDDGLTDELMGIRKYQRVSFIVADLLECFARVSKYSRSLISEKANITVIWSPSGGVGKTTVALSYAMKKAAEGRQVLYLNLESFASSPAYFLESGRSISTVFEMLENDEGDVKMAIRGIYQQDKEAGVAYFCKPENFADMYALTADNIGDLITACAGVTEELVIDLSCACDLRTEKTFDLADKIMIVTDQTITTDVKLSQFISQHSVFESIKDKLAVVANKGAMIEKDKYNEVFYLPTVASADPIIICKTLSAGFESIL